MAERQAKPEATEDQVPIKDRHTGKTIGTKNKTSIPEATSDDANFEEGNSRRKPKEEKKEKPRKTKKEKTVTKKEPIETKPRADKVAKALSEAEGNAKVLTAARKSPFFKFINKEAFEKAVKKQDKIGEGLFRMRIGNMMRGAEKRAKEAK